MEKGQSLSAARFSIALFCLGTFLFWAALYVYVPILSAYARHLGASLSLAGLVVGAYGLTQLILRIPLGALSDRWGRRKPFIVLGQALAVLGTLGLALSPNPWGLVASRAMLGVAASTWVTSTILFSSYFPPRQVTRAMGLVSVLSSSAQLAVSPAGGKMAEEWGWQAPFWAGVGLAVMGTACMAGIWEHPQARGASVSLRHIGRVGTTPLLFVVSIACAFSIYTVFTTAYSFTPIYALELGATKAQLGLLTTFNLLPSIIGSLSVAGLADHLEERKAAATGLALLAGATLATPFIHSFQVLAASQALAGFGRGLNYPVLMGLSVRAVPREDQATAMGIFQATYAIGMFVGPSFSGMIADALGLKGMFLSAGAVCIVGMLVALAGIPGREMLAQRERGKAAC